MGRGSGGREVCGPGDFDFGTGGVQLARPQGITLPGLDNFTVLTVGKEGIAYVIDPSAMVGNTAPDSTDACTQGGSGAVTLQCFSAMQLPIKNLWSGGTGGTPVDYVGIRDGSAFWPGNSTSNENWLYVVGNEDPYIRAYQMGSSGGGTFNLASEASSPAPITDSQFSGFPYPGASPVVTWDSAHGTTANAVLWIYATNQALSNVHGGLFAYTAVPASNSLGTPLFSDTTHGPYPTKFSQPTIAYGHVYVAGVKSPPSTNCTGAGSCTGKVVVWH
jgi:hypothetical protein